MPTVTKFVDQMRAVFGHDQVKVIFASENGKEVGKRTEEPMFDAIPWAEFMKTEGQKK